MKRLIALVLSFTMIFCVSCGSQTVEPNSDTKVTPVASTAGKAENKSSSATEKSADGEHETEQTEQVEPAESEDSSILVAYFSATGTTEKLAEYAEEILGADIHEITPAEPYTDEDLEYYTDCRADREQNDPDARPEISGSVEGMAQYDTVILGYPIWHGQAPKIIYTFLESYDFSGKTILPFCPSHSSGIGTSAENLHELAPDANWLDGERFAAGTDKDEIADWLDENDIKASAAVWKFDFEKGTVMLNSGYKMPIIGLGTYSLSDEECYNLVTALLDAGGRVIDTAYMYGNEAAVGRAIRDSDVPREDIFVITKIYPRRAV